MSFCVIRCLLSFPTLITGSYLTQRSRTKHCLMLSQRSVTALSARRSEKKTTETRACSQFNRKCFTPKQSNRSEQKMELWFEFSIWWNPGRLSNEPRLISFTQWPFQAWPADVYRNISQIKHQDFNVSRRLFLYSGVIDLPDVCFYFQTCFKSNCFSKGSSISQKKNFRKSFFNPKVHFLNNVYGW